MIIIYSFLRMERTNASKVKLWTIANYPREHDKKERSLVNSNKLNAEAI